MSKDSTNAKRQRKWREGQREAGLVLVSRWVPKSIEGAVRSAIDDLCYREACEHIGRMRGDK